MYIYLYKTFTEGIHIYSEKEKGVADDESVFNPINQVATRYF